MSSFNVLGLKVTILLLIILVPCIIIGGMISLCSFLKEKISEIKDGMQSAKNTRGESSKWLIFRRENLGFIFQDFNLLDTLTISENISLALIINKEDVNKVEEKVINIAEKLGIKKF